MPDWKPHIRSRLASLRLSSSRENEIIEELSQHLEDRWRELVAGGASEDEATKLALAGFREGDLLARHLAPLRQAHAPEPITPGASAGRLLGDLWQDLRYAARTLRKQPTFALAAILTLALGIGANTAIFTVVNATLLQRLPVPDRDRLVYVQREKNGGVFPYPMYTALRDGTQAFEGVAAWSGFVASLNAGDGADRTFGYLVTGNFFDVLGLAADRGRLLSPADDVTPGGHPVVVISRELWQTRFAGRPDIIGHEIRLNGNVFTIVGVTPAGFPGPRVGTVRHLYVPMMMQPILRPPSDRLQSTRELAVPPGTPQAGSHGNTGARGDRDAGDDPCARSESIDDAGADARRADRRGQSRIASADARGRVPARRRGRGGAADCVREYREPAAGEGHGASARAGRAPRDRRQPRAARAATADRERAAVGRRRHRRARPGVGAGAGVPGLSAAGGCASRRDRPRDRSARAALLDRALADRGPRVRRGAGAEGVAAGPRPGAQGGVQRRATTADVDTTCRNCWW